MKTVGDTLPYFSAVVQVIPVLLLAFVLEARGFARRYGQGRSNGGTARKLVFGVWMAITVAGLLGAFTLALGALLSDPASEITSERLASIGLATFMTINGLIFVAFVPSFHITALFTSLGFAAIEDSLRSNRWSLAARRRRMTISLRQRIDAKIRAQIARRHELLIEWSLAERRAFRYQSRIARFDHEIFLGSRPKPHVDELLARANWGSEVRAADAQAGRARRAAARLTERIDEGQTLLGVFDHNIQQPVPRGGSLERYEESLRKVLAEAGAA